MFGDFLNIIYPNNCVCCDNTLYKQEQFVCTACELELPETNFEASINNPASKLLTGRTEFNTCLPLYYYQTGGKVQKILQSMKYRGNEDICVEMGRRIGFQIKKRNEIAPDLIVPVPLHPLKMKKRGYNQSEKIAEGIASILGAEIEHKNLHRIHNNATQTTKSRKERWENVHEVFALKDLNLFVGKHVLLVDDVITTGSTVEACCNVLNQTDGIKISIATLATA